jgi:hypothetical protein
MVNQKSVMTVGKDLAVGSHGAGDAHNTARHVLKKLEATLSTIGGRIPQRHEADVKGEKGRGLRLIAPGNVDDLEGHRRSVRFARDDDETNWMLMRYGLQRGQHKVQVLEIPHAAYPAECCGRRRCSVISLRGIQGQIDARRHYDGVGRDGVRGREARDHQYGPPRPGWGAAGQTRATA